MSDAPDLVEEALARLRTELGDGNGGDDLGTVEWEIEHLSAIKRRARHLIANSPDPAAVHAARFILGEVSA